MSVGSGRHRLLSLDASYSLEFIRANKLEASITCRDLGGYFDRVWTVHPFGTLVTTEAWAPRFGRPVSTKLSPVHTFIEGKVGRTRWFVRTPRINFAAAQVDVLGVLARLVRRERIDVIRAGDPLLMGLYGVLLSKACRIPLVVRLGANYERLRHETGRPLMPKVFPSADAERRVERFVLEHAHLVAAANQDYVTYALGMGAKQQRTTIFRYGNLVHPSHLTEPRERTGGVERVRALGLEGRPFLMCVGRLLSAKMSDHPLRVLSGLRARGIDAAVLMVGDGAMAAELRRLASELGIERDVVFAGNRDQEWLASVIPLAAVVLSPATGRALCEVAFGAAPVVAYDFDWQGELVRSGVTGELVPLGDIDAMTSATARLLEDRERAATLGTQLRAAAFEMLDPARLDAHERAAYERVFADVNRQG